MSFVAALLAPLVMLMPLPQVGPASGPAERERVAVEAPASGLALPAEAAFPAFDALDTGIFQQIVQSFRHPIPCPCTIIREHPANSSFQTTH